MVELPKTPFIELQNQGYRLAGTRVSLDSVAYEVLRGRTVDEILEDFPSLKSCQNLESAIAYIRAHPKEIDAYLAGQEREWAEAIKSNPPHLLEKIRRAQERNRRPA